MRFLCLHGMGTSSQILQMQTAALRHELGDHHTFEYVEGCLAVPTAPEIASLFANTSDGEDQYFAYFDPTDASTGHKAMQDLEAFLAAEGPFDGVLAFSQGATLASTFMARQAELHPTEPAPFKCAIFFAGGRIADWRAVEQGIVRFADISSEPDFLTIPTCHIWGRNDTLWPGTSADLVKGCRAQTRQELIWDGGHEIPGSSHQNVLYQSVHLIRRTIDQALMEQ